MFSKIFVLFVILTSAYTQDMRIAHVDSRLIFKKYSGIQQAQMDYESQLAVWEQKANVLKKELNEIRERLEKQSLILTVEKKQELNRKFAQKETELKEFVEKIYGSEGELVKENHKISEPLIKNIKNAIYEVSLQEGYDMVLDRSSGAILFWKDEHDLTGKVIEELTGQKIKTK